MNAFYEEILNERGQFDKLWEENVRILCSTAGTAGRADRKFFNQLWEGWAFAMILGIKNNRHLPLEGKKNQWGELAIIKNRNEETFKGLVLLALSTVDSLEEYIDEPKRLVQVMNEYAKGGAEIIQEIRATPGQENYFNNEIDYIKELLARKNPKLNH